MCGGGAGQSSAPYVDYSSFRQRSQHVHVLVRRGQKESVYPPACTATYFDPDLLRQLAQHLQ